VRLDVPTLADPTVRALLQESELFARSFTSSGFGILSPLEFIHIVSLLTEIVSHIFLIVSLTRGVSHLGILVLSILSTMLPMFLSWFTWPQREMESIASEKEARAANRQERLRSLAYSDVHRPEVALFGLSDWILKSWKSARKIVLASEQPYYVRSTSVLDQFNLSELVYAVQNVRISAPLCRVISSFLFVDTAAVIVSDVIYISRLLDGLSDFHPKPAFRLPKSGQHDENGLPGNFLDVCVLFQHEIETVA